MNASISKTYPSKSSPGTSYTAQVDARTGLLSCDCRGWINKREGQPRHCTHTKALAAEYSLELEERDGQLFVVNKKDPRPAVNPRTERLKAESASAIRLAPMLASAMPTGWDADRYDYADFTMEEKFDGHRIVSRVGPSGLVRAWSRGEKDRTLPTHIHILMAQLPEGVYDGELIVPGGHSYDVTAGQNSGTERYVLFDLLESLGKSTLAMSYEIRRQLLEAAYESIGPRVAISLALQMVPGMKAVEKIWKRGGEGAIIKRLGSHYVPGYRSDDWIKVKKSASAILVITGYEPGKVGKYSAVRIRDDAGIETTVKTLDNATMRAMERNPSKFIGKRLVISYQERTPSGKYRHPMWDHVL